MSGVVDVVRMNQVPLYSGVASLHAADMADGAGGDKTMDGVGRFRAGLAAVKRRRRPVWGREAKELAGELAGLLAELRHSDVGGRQGVDLVAAFLRTDRHVFEHCDDSSGYVGDVYRISAPLLFRDFACRCDDARYLSELIFELVSDDGYGVRDPLLNDVGIYLPEAEIRRLIVLFRGMESGDVTDSFSLPMGLVHVCNLARQIGDVGLFESTMVGLYGADHPHAAYDIAAVHLEHDNPQAALSWLERIPADASYRLSQRNELMFQALGKLGMTDSQVKLAWMMFRHDRGAGALERLVAILGEQHRAAVVDGEVALILSGTFFRLEDLTFLVGLGRFEQAERYMLDRVEKIDGYNYEFLLPLARTLDLQGHQFGASLIYRALTESILNRATYNAYSHGARYLQVLDQMAVSVSDWRGLPDHDTWRAALHAAHSRKTSFWAHYRGE